MPTCSQASISVAVRMLSVKHQLGKSFETFVSDTAKTGLCQAEDTQCFGATHRRHACDDLRVKQAYLTPANAI